MHPARAAVALFASIAFSVLATSPTLAATPEAISRGRDLLAHDDAKGAIAVLEGALPGEPALRPELVRLLRDAYAKALRQAEANGKGRDAELFRENLEILNRKVRPASAGAATPPSDTAVLPASPRPEPAPATIRPVSLAPREVTPAPSPAPSAASMPALAIAPAPAATTSAAPTVAAADAAFRAKLYNDAGRIYAALAQQNRLPKDRRDHWAYCRCVDVVRRLNARPTDPKEWELIDSEIIQIRALSPNIWFAEYLRSRASERGPGRQSNKVVVRGSAPEEPAPAAAPAPAPAPAPRPAAAPGQWQIRETANFRILHADPALAAQVAQIAEAARETQVRRWTDAAPREPWTPRCDIYIYPDAKSFSRMTGQPEQSPGFSTMGMNSGRIVARRINLRADHPNILPAILPHEITHVVLADLFPHQQIPRWADEGMAVLSEPPSEQRFRAADLDKPLTTGQIFKLDDLMVMDYPDGKFWGLYYAQSVSLTRFLVEQGTPAQFIAFVQGAQRNGFDAEMRRVYKIEGFADLHKRWVAYARSKSGEMTASATADASVKEAATASR